MLQLFNVQKNIVSDTQNQWVIIKRLTFIKYN